MNAVVRCKGIHVAVMFVNLRELKKFPRKPPAKLFHGVHNHTPDVAPANAATLGITQKPRQIENVEFDSKRAQRCNTPLEKNTNFPIRKNYHVRIATCAVKDDLASRPGEALVLARADRQMKPQEFGRGVREKHARGSIVVNQAALTLRFNQRLVPPPTRERFAVVETVAHVTTLLIGRVPRVKAQNTVRKLHDSRLITPGSNDPADRPRMPAIVA